MSFSTANPPRLLIETGLYLLSPLDTQSSRSAPNIWLYYGSTDSSTDIGANNPYFTGMGRPVPVSGAYIPPALGNVGMKVNDLVLSVPATSATTPRATFLTVTGSTASISTANSSYWANVLWNVSATT